MIYNILAIVMVNVAKIILLELLAPYAYIYFNIQLMSKIIGVYNFGIGWCLIMIIGCNCLGGLLNILSKYLYYKTYPVLSKKLREALFRSSLKMSTDFVMHEGEGILEAINESIATGTTDTVEYIVENIIPGTILLLSYLVYIFIQSFTLGLLHTFLLVVYVILFLYLFSRTFKLAKLYNKAQNKRTSKLIDVFKRLKLIRIFNIQHNLFSYILQSFQTEFTQHNNYLKSDLINTSIISMVYFILEVSIYYYLYRSIVNSSIAPNIVLNILNFSLSMTDNMNDIMKDILEIYESAGQVQHSLQQLISKSYTVPENAKILTNKITSIKFKNVTVKRNDQYILKNLNLELKNKDTLVIVGESGIGKSTLLNVILGLTTVDEGEVLINGIDIKKYKLSSLHNGIIYIGQNNEFFNTSIRENLKLFNPKLKKQAINKKLKEFQLDILTNKIDNSIGSGGGRLSGGQATRLSILRAIVATAYKNIYDKIFLADEPTTGLDRPNQEIIVKYINNIQSGIKIITDHSGLFPLYSTQVLYLFKNGGNKIGSHEYLYKLLGSYRKFFSSDIIC